MRDNGPVTGREVHWEEGEILVSGTDTGGRIKFANQAFVDISGFTEDDLTGAPHNIVRHPDMPSAAFADLWETIKSGHVWEGLVKNRTKSGDHYWVNANVTPVVENGEAQGFISIRSKPSREDVAHAEAVYSAIRNDRGGGYGLDHGEIVNTTTGARIRGFFGSVVGMISTVAVITVIATVLVAATGLYGEMQTADRLEAVYSQRVVPLKALKQVSDDYAVFVVDASHKVRNGNFSWEDGIANIEQAEARIKKVWNAYKANVHSERETEIISEVEDLIAPTDQLVQDLLEMFKTKDIAGLDTAVKDRLYQTIDPLTGKIGELIDLQLSAAEAQVEAANSEFVFLVSIIAAMAAIAALVALVSCITLYKAVRRPIDRLRDHFLGIAGGDPDYVIEMPTTAELRPVTRELRALRARFIYEKNERREAEAKTEIVRRTAVLGMADTVENESNAAVEQVSAKTNSMASDADGMASSAERVSVNAQSVAAAADQAMANIQTVASATEELSSSISEITNQINQASEITKTAVQKGQSTQEAIRTLATAVEQIGDVVGLIQAIANQTNLLALNATIEAARAGEAGKGFAVVASEVKSLASQTSEATEEITRHISEIQSGTSSAVRAVEEIGSAVQEIDQISGAIAAAMEEQSATTNEINRNIAETTEAAREVSARIAEVSQDANETGRQAAEVRIGSSEVASAIENLRNVIVRVVRTSTSEADRRETNVAVEVDRRAR